MASGPHLSTDLAFALRFEGSRGSGLAWGYCVATACLPSGREHPVFKICGSGRKEGDAAAPLPCFVFFFFPLSLYYLFSSGRPCAERELGSIPQRYALERGDSFKELNWAWEIQVWTGKEGGGAFSKISKLVLIFSLIYGAILKHEDTSH